MNDLSHFPLEKAYLCQDCNAVGNSRHQVPGLRFRGGAVPRYGAG
jgi:hypothetical protein